MTRRRTENTAIRLLAGLLLFAFCCAWPSGAGVQGDSANWQKRSSGKPGRRPATKPSSQWPYGSNGSPQRFGEEALDAARTCGPQLETILNEAGEAGAPLAIKLLARHGDDAVWIARRPEALKTISDRGPEAMDAYLKHKAIAHLLVTRQGPTPDPLRSM